MAICPICGRESDNTKQCKYCGYWYLIVSYEENGNWINKEEYWIVKQNVSNNKKHILTCPECGEKLIAYYDGYGLTCSCGGFFSLSRGNEVESFRKAKKWTQKDLGDKFGVSRSYIAAIESGRKTVPKNMLKVINN